MSLKQLSWHLVNERSLESGISVKKAAKVLDLSDFSLGDQVKKRGERTGSQCADLQETGAPPSNPGRNSNSATGKAFYNRGRKPEWKFLKEGCSITGCKDI